MNDRIVRQLIALVDTTGDPARVGRSHQEAATAPTRTRDPCYECRLARKACKTSEGTDDARCDRCRGKGLPLKECILRVDYRELLQTYLIVEELRGLILQQENTENENRTTSVTPATVAASGQRLVSPPIHNYNSSNLLQPGNLSLAVSNESTPYQTPIHSPTAAPTDNYGWPFQYDRGPYFRYEDPAMQPQSRVHVHSGQPVYAHSQLEGLADNFFGMRLEHPYNTIPSFPNNGVVNSFNNVINGPGPPRAEMNVNAGVQTEALFDNAQETYNVWNENRRTA